MTAIDERFSAPTAIPTMTLHNEVQMPVLGLGVAKLSDSETENSVLAAIEAGCRLIDTAAAYGNEEAVGRAIAASGVDRGELWVTTKLGTSKQGFESAQESCKASLDRLGLDYLDLYLIHWPAPSVGKYVESFAGMIQSRDEGHVRSIGVCNFTEDHLRAVIEETNEVPAVNQIELHPRLNQADLRATHDEHAVVTQSYSPLGVGRMLEHPTVSRRRRVRALAGAGARPLELAVGQCGGLAVVEARAGRGEPRRVRLQSGRRAHGRLPRAA
jgi:diketogulonate reductase-like aldo/keto reductase